jgi:hypothetical protein
MFVPHLHVWCVVVVVVPEHAHITGSLGFGSIQFPRENRIIMQTDMSPFAA